MFGFEIGRRKVNFHVIEFILSYLILSYYIHVALVRHGILLDIKDMEVLKRVTFSYFSKEI